LIGSGAAKQGFRLLPEVEQYTIHELTPALVQGGLIDDAKRKEAAGKMAYYSGIS